MYFVTISIDRSCKIPKEFLVRKAKTWFTIDVNEKEYKSDKCNISHYTETYRFILDLNDDLVFDLSVKFYISSFDENKSFGYAKLHVEKDLNDKVAFLCVSEQYDECKMPITLKFDKIDKFCQSSESSYSSCATNGVGSASLSFNFSDTMDYDDECSLVTKVIDGKKDSKKSSNVPGTVHNKYNNKKKSATLTLVDDGRNKKNSLSISDVWDHEECIKSNCELYDTMTRGEDDQKSSKISDATNKNDYVIISSRVFDIISSEVNTEQYPDESRLVDKENSIMANPELLSTIEKRRAPKIDSMTFDSLETKGCSYNSSEVYDQVLIYNNSNKKVLQKIDGSYCHHEPELNNDSLEYEPVNKEYTSEKEKSLPKTKKNTVSSKVTSSKSSDICSLNDYSATFPCSSANINDNNTEENKNRFTPLLSSKGTKTRKDSKSNFSKNESADISIKVCKVQTSGDKIENVVYEEDVDSYLTITSDDELSQDIYSDTDNQRIMHRSSSEISSELYYDTKSEQNELNHKTNMSMFNKCQNTNLHTERDDIASSESNNTLKKCHNVNEDPHISGSICDYSYNLLESSINMLPCEKNIQLINSDLSKSDYIKSKSNIMYSSVQKLIKTYDKVMNDNHKRTILKNYGYSDSSKGKIDLALKYNFSEMFTPQPMRYQYKTYNRFSPRMKAMKKTKQYKGNIYSPSEECLLSKAYRNNIKKSYTISPRVRTFRKLSDDINIHDNKGSTYEFYMKNNCRSPKFDYPFYLKNSRIKSKMSISPNKIRRGYVTNVKKYKESGNNIILLDESPVTNDDLFLRSLRDFMTSNRLIIGDVEKRLNLYKEFPHLLSERIWNDLEKAISETCLMIEKFSQIEEGK